jgi:type VI secretion system protein ImpF
MDRLIDHEPEADTEARAGWVGPLEAVKDSVRANLVALLNARRPLVELPAGPNHLQRSVLAYGLPDFTHFGMETADERELLRSAIEAAIRRFEPRLSRVVVSPPEIDPNGRSLRFQVDAVLNVKPAPEVVSFDSVLLLPTRTFELRG